MKSFQQLFAVLLFGLGLLPLSAQEPGHSIVVIYNSKIPVSQQVAQHYAKCRQIPSDHVFGFRLPTSETMTRTEFHDKLQQPLLKALQQKELFTFATIPGKPGDKEDSRKRQVTAAKIRYAVLCYGVPLRIVHDSSLKEQGTDQIPEHIRVNGAAVDSELATLPLSERKLTLTGPLISPFFGVTNSSELTPTNGLLMVARLDGPTPEIACSLVDKALQAEADGLWGRAYFDLRGITNGPYKAADDWFRTGSQITRRYGFETVADEKPETFPTSFPMSQIAVYAGWYQTDVCGPFAQPKVELMPGAFAYHLHSFSARTLHTTNQAWVGPLLSAGATVTMGSVDEPQLDGTPVIDVFIARWMLLGFSFGEAAYAAQKTLSWQTTVVGDPLYRPFAKPPRERFEILLKRNSKLIEWSHLQVANINLETGLPANEVISYLENLALTPSSAVLTEKLGDLHLSQKNSEKALSAYKNALKLQPTPQQHARLTEAIESLSKAAGEKADGSKAHQSSTAPAPSR